ncbi:sensor histidine kinase [Thalassotalea ganghwensis]
MSLRRYLFILIGGLIILLTCSQLVLLFWLEQNIKQDVETKVRHINERALDVALDKVLILEARQKIHESINESTKTNVTPNIEPSPPTKTQRSIKIIEVDASKPIEEHVTFIDEMDDIAVDKHILKKEFKTQIEFLLAENKDKIKQIKKPPTYVINNENAYSFWTSNTEQTSTTKTLIRTVQTSLIVGALVALIFAYWLSVQFNKPLRALSEGFKALADGHYKNKVKPSGVKEIRSTINRFNDMVVKLDSLSQAEQHHKEIAHLAELGEVSRGLAHALRNPIHTIGLSVEQLLSNDLPLSKQQHLLFTIQQKLLNLDKSIKALLTLTTSGIDRSAKVPLLAVVQDIILEFKSSYPKQLTFKTDIEASITLIGAESEIRSILHTLISNACEASENNATIKISAIVKNNILSFSVCDNGSGIDSKIEAELFKPHISTKPEGAGMGLYIAKRLITLHYGGDLNLENTILDDKVTGCKATALFKLT